MRTQKMDARPVGKAGTSEARFPPVLACMELDCHGADARREVRTSTGVELIEAFRAHGLAPAYLIQHRLICAWRGDSPRQADALNLLAEILARQVGPANSQKTA